MPTVNCGLVWGLMHTYHITKLLKSHWSLIWLRSSVGKTHLNVNYRDILLKSNDEKVGSKSEVNILFFLILYVVCFSGLFLFMYFRDYLNICDIKMHFSLACCRRYPLHHSDWSNKTHIYIVSYSIHLRRSSFISR